MFLDGNKQKVIKDLQKEMESASKELKFEKAARLRDQIQSLENLNLRGDIEEHAQPEVFTSTPRKVSRD
ncbi:MAG: UvrB/UvrC motif-containing protein [Planctomycetaceae bacterium]